MIEPGKTTKIFMISLLFVLIFTTRSKSQNPIFSGDSIVLLENSLKKLNKNINFIIVPGPVYGATERLGFVILPMIVYNLDADDKLSPPSSTALMLYFDFHGSWQLAAKQSFYWNQNKWRAFITAGIGKMSLRFFGIGRDTVVINNDPSNYFWTSNKEKRAMVSCFRRIAPGLYGGLEYNYQNSYLNTTDSAGAVILDQSGINPGETITESIIIPTFVWDNRDHIFWTTKGYFANFNFQLSNEFLFSSSDYGIITGDVSGYHRLLKDSDRLTLGWNLFLQKGWGELPYTRLATYGRGDHVMGYTRGKYVNNSEISIQSELRYDLWKFIALGGYLGTGKTFQETNLAWKSVWLHFGGLRTYLNIIPSRNIRLRFDFAIARKDVGFYMGIGQGF
jgi:hypothetical protein